MKLHVSLYISLAVVLSCSEENGAAQYDAHADANIYIFAVLIWQSYAF